MRSWTRWSRSRAAGAPARRPWASAVPASSTPRPARWTWALAHRAHFRNALAQHRSDSALEPALQPADGDGSTVCVGSSYAPWSFEFGHGPVYRHVVDLADSTTSWFVIPPWNSAAHRSHSANMLARWAGHAYAPLRLDWTRIERDAAETLEFAGGTAR